METALNKKVSNQVIDEDGLSAALNLEKAFCHHSSTVVDLDPFVVEKYKLIEEQLVEQKSSIDRIAACILAYKHTKDESTI